MTYSIFVPQLDGCTYHAGGDNCSCATEAMWLFRASQGKIRTTSCHVRELTGDKVAGTNLDEMVDVSAHYGITNGVLWKPSRFDDVRHAVVYGRRGSHLQLDYSPIAASPYDCFSGRFFGGHDVYLDSGDDTHAVVGDPGADGRRPGIPTGYQQIPWTLLAKAAGMLVINTAGQTMNDRYGPGHAFAYLTPADPVPAYVSVNVVIHGATPLYDKPFGARVRAVRSASYRCQARQYQGVWWYRIISRSDGTLAANHGLYLRPSRYTDSTRLP